MSQVLTLDRVSKKFTTGLFHRKVALNYLSLDIGEGQVVGLLGPNGSGKSTTLKIVLGLLRPDSGVVKVCGYVPSDSKARAQIGYLPENPRFQRFLTARQILSYFGQLLGIERSKLREKIPALLELVHLDAVAREKVGGFSKGMTQRLAIAQALLNDPKLLILDEPMSGLDPDGRTQMRNLIARIHSERSQSTVLFSTHSVADAEDLCSSIVVLKQGSLVCHSDIETFLKQRSASYEIVFAPLVPEYKERKDVQKIGSGWMVRVEEPKDLVREIDRLTGQHASILSVHSKRGPWDSDGISDEVIS